MYYGHPTFDHLLLFVIAIVILVFLEYIYLLLLYWLDRSRPHSVFVSVSSFQLGWVKRASWLEAVMAGPGRPRGRLPTNWVQRIAVQQAQASGKPIKIPKKRGPKPGSKVRLNRSSSPNHTIHISMRTLWVFSLIVHCGEIPSSTR